MESMLNTEDAERLVAPAECECVDLCRMQMQTLHGDSSAQVQALLPHPPESK